MEKDWKIEVAGKEISPRSCLVVKKKQVYPPGTLKVTLSYANNILSHIKDRNNFTLSLDGIISYQIIKMRKLPNKNAYYLHHNGGFKTVTTTKMLD